MSRRGRRIEGSVVVITGASSGIGRAAARRFAQRGASVVLAARSEEGLQATARECEAAGGDTLRVPTDVCEEEAVQALARAAVERFGRIDVWVNNAGVILYGDFRDTPSQVYRQVIETNLFGQIHGSRAALEHFEARGRGVLVNVASLWGRVTSPYVSPYVVSKFGVRALSQCLRQEVRDAKDIHVCMVHPESIDTPIFRHAANFSGRPIRPVPPIADPDRAVRAILSSVERPRAERTVGGVGHLLAWGDALMPSRLWTWLVPQVFRWAAFGSGRREPTPGNLFEPGRGAPNRVDDGWRQTPANKLGRRVVAGSLGATPLVVAALIARRVAGR